MDETYECIVIGGGAAGLSASLVLGRARRRTLLLDAGGQSNRPAAGIGGLLGHDGRPPAELYALGHDELTKYPSVESRAATAAQATRSGDGFAVTLDDSTVAQARLVLLATGCDYEPPTLPGVAERWGRSVFHCPFCHGWEVREQPLAVLGGSAANVERARLLKAWSDDVTLLTCGDELEPEAPARLAAAGVAVDARIPSGLRGPSDALEAVEFEDGSELALGGLLVAAPMRARSAIAEQLGAQLGEPNPVFTTYVVVDSMLRTTVPGLIAAGDVTGEMPSVANAVAAGSRAAAMIVHELTSDRG
jgi:thioredoxin reductase